MWSRTLYNGGSAERSATAAGPNTQGIGRMPTVWLITLFTRGGGKGHRPRTHTAVTVTLRILVTGRGRKGHRPRSHAIITIT